MSQESTEFAGRAVVIVGAAEGVGPAVVRAFLDRKARIATDRSDRAAPPGVLALPLDLGAGASVTQFFDRCEAELGGLDVLVMIAKSVTVGRVLDVDPDALRRIVNEELVDVALCMQEGARRMAARRKGRIIAFASMSGKTGVHPGVGPYAAAKGGLITFSRVLAAELAASGVTVNAIATALFEPQVAVLTEDHRRDVVRGIPVGRFGRSEEAAHAVLFLASDEAGYVTGETLNMSGGRFMD